MKEDISYKPGDLYEITTQLLCGEISPRKLQAGNVIMILSKKSTIHTNVLFENRIIEFHNESLQYYTKKI